GRGRRGRRGGGLVGRAGEGVARRRLVVGGAAHLEDDGGRGRLRVPLRAGRGRRGVGGGDGRRRGEGEGIGRGLRVGGVLVGGLGGLARGEVPQAPPRPADGRAGDEEEDQGAHRPAPAAAGDAPPGAGGAAVTGHLR